MGHNEVDKIVTDAKHAPSQGGDKHDMSHVFKDVQDLQAKEKVAQPAQYKQDMIELNQKLHAAGILPNVELVDTAQNPRNNQDQLVLEDKHGRLIAKDASSVDNNVGQLNKAGLDLDDPRQAVDALMAKALGINLTGNADGSFDVKSSFMDMLNDPVKAGMNIISMLEKELLNPGSSGSEDASQLASLGMNPMMARAWMGWPEEKDTSTDADDTA